MEIKNIIAFCILMENDGGILEKSPGYVIEKYKRYCESISNDDWKWGLDNINYLKLKKWAKDWLHEDINKD